MTGRDRAVGDGPGSTAHDAARAYRGYLAIQPKLDGNAAVFPMPSLVASVTA